MAGRLELGSGIEGAGNGGRRAGEAGVTRNGDDNLGGGGDEDGGYLEATWAWVSLACPRTPTDRNCQRQIEDDGKGHIWL